MDSSLLEGFTKSLAMTVLSEIGDKTFFAAALSRKWTHHVTTVLFFGFGLWSLWEAFTGDGESQELAEVEAKLNADWKTGTAGSKGTSKDNDDSKKQQTRFLTQLFSPIFLKAFSITFFGEWGDKSQIATIGLASDMDPFGVVLGGIIGQAICTTAAVLGGKSLATQISEKMVSLSSGVLFLVFGFQSFLASAAEL
ncbi:GDT1-like protein 5 isoform X3 [Phalaenopsis equestris]|uniref:GDT1-like protein 5 isoform X3 n=1 Tax=Phalaenopsis equestris TaxID=78828 RepID=UPI0009E268C3|nr:GDT1-like protein 5 isoform X3 [Phalaenopsis equestris]